MNKFGLLDDDEAAFVPDISLADRIAAFPSVRPRTSMDMPAIDAAAAQHGFISREASTPASTNTNTRRRRAAPSEPTRHLAIRLTTSGYARFVAYADRKQLTYHDALLELLKTAGA